MLAVLLSGCGDDQDPEGARLLWEAIQREGYRSFARAPGYPGRRPTRAPHADEVEIYVNAEVERALDSPLALDAWPVGSLIVKDGWDGNSLDIVAAMQKRADGWFWVEWSGDGTSLFSGRPETCLGCHRIGDDWVRAFGLPLGP